MMSLSSRHLRVRKLAGKKKFIALALNLIIWPGIGQLYLQKKAKAYFFVGSELLLMAGALIRFMSAMFYLLNVRPDAQSLNVWTIMLETWQSDQEVLLVMLLGIFLVWLLALLDLWMNFRER